MQLYLLRHGISEDAAAGQPDSSRALTSEGKKKLRPVLEAARKAGVAPTLIITSPYRRAEETAEIAANELDYKEPPLRSKALIPSGAPATVWEEIRVHKDESQLMLVGHEPLFGMLTGFLLASPELSIDFKKGAIVRIDLAQFGAHPAGTLRWLLVPKIAG